MTDWTEQQIIGHLLGALDDDEQAYLDARLERDESCCRRMAHWRRRLSPLEMMRPDYEPPPGLAERTCRLVDAFGPAPPRLQPQRDSLSPAMVQLGGPSPVGWTDLIALGSLLLMLAALMLPALNAGRLHARSAACQNNLRRLGLAMTEYGRLHEEPLRCLAVGGGLTGAGLYAAELLEDAFTSDNGRPLCPDAWLAAQGAARDPLPQSTTIKISPASLKAFPRQEKISPASPTRFPRRTLAPGEPLVAAGGDTYACLLPGDWRNGNRDATQAEVLADAVPLLADVPSVISPGEAVELHGERGRNVFFEDGRLGRLPPAAAGPNPAELPAYPLADEPPPSLSTPPIIFVNRHATP